MEAIVEAVGPVASFTFYFYFFSYWEYYHIKFQSVIHCTSSFDKQIICSTFNHVVILTLIKILFMLQIILKLWSHVMKFQDLKALPFKMLSWVQSPHKCYYMIISISLKIISILLKLQVTPGLDATFFFLFFTCGTHIYATDFDYSFFFFLIYLVDHFFYWYS